MHFILSSVSGPREVFPSVLDERPGDCVANASQRAIVYVRCGLRIAQFMGEFQIRQANASTSEISWRTIGGTPQRPGSSRQARERVERCERGGS